MKRMMVNIVASALIVGVVGAAMASDVSPKMLRQADKAAARALAAMQDHQRDDAVRYAERAVLYNPASADNRALLGQAYLQAGRLHSAESAFGDALRLDATHGRAALGLGLVEAALGHTDRALSALAQARGRVAATDLGLALALAGDREGALMLLEPAARAADASPKARQNLALTYALSGRWAEARVTASQDIAPNQLDQRMIQWAQFVRPRGSADQLASLLGVKTVMDSGMPTELALLEVPAAQAAAVAVAPVAERPLQVVARADVPESTQPQDVVPAAEAALPVRLVVPEEKPQLVRAPESLPVPIPAPSYVRPVAVPATNVIVSAPRDTQPRRGNFVVQLGAFSSETRLEQAWVRAVHTVGSLDDYAPVSSAFALSQGRHTVYRLAVGGFATRDEAVTLCGKVRAKGGDCFVRGRAGDAPVQWVKRKTSTVYASR